MRMPPRPSRRPSFTLIELLVVISILAVLAAMTMGAIARVKASQLRVTTETTVKKLQVGVEQAFNASVDEAGKANNVYYQFVTPYCDGDKDRAKALMTYLYAKRDFPQTFAEARNGLILPGAGTLPPNNTFATVAPGVSNYVLPPDQEAAALLYLIVTAAAKRGAAIDADGSLAGAEMVLPNTNIKAYKDAYGTHIAFIRWYGPYVGPSTWGKGTGGISGPNGATNGIAYAANAETQQAPFVNNKFVIKDPYDPLGKLLPQGTGIAPGWGNIPARTGALAVLNQNYGIGASPAGPYTPLNFDTFNKIITVVSAGPDKTFGTGDDVYGYPLGRIGAKGD